MCAVARMAGLERRSVTLRMKTRSFFLVTPDPDPGSSGIEAGSCVEGASGCIVVQWNVRWPHVQNGRFRPISARRFARLHRTAGWANPTARFPDRARRNRACLAETPRHRAMRRHSHAKRRRSGTSPRFSGAVGGERRGLRSDTPLHAGQAAGTHGARRIIDPRFGATEFEWQDRSESAAVGSHGGAEDPQGNRPPTQPGRGSSCPDLARSPGPNRYRCHRKFLRRGRPFHDGCADDVGNRDDFRQKACTAHTLVRRGNGRGPCKTPV